MQSRCKIKWDANANKSFFIFIYLFILAVTCGMWDPSSLTGDRTRAPCIGSAESQPLDHKGSLLEAFLNEKDLPSCCLAF